MRVLLFRPDKKPIAIHSRMVNDHRRLIPFEIRARNAEPLEIQSSSAYRILRGRPFEFEEPEWHVGCDQTFFGRSVHQNAKAPNSSSSYCRWFSAANHVSGIIERQQRSEPAETRPNLSESSERFRGGGLFNSDGTVRKNPECREAEAGACDECDEQAAGTQCHDTEPRLADGLRLSLRRPSAPLLLNAPDNQ